MMSRWCQSLMITWPSPWAVRHYGLLGLNLAISIEIFDDWLFVLSSRVRHMENLASGEPWRKGPLLSRHRRRGFYVTSYYLFVNGYGWFASFHLICFVDVFQRLIYLSDDSIWWFSVVCLLLYYYCVGGLSSWLQIHLKDFLFRVFYVSSIFGTVICSICYSLVIQHNKY